MDHNSTTPKKFDVRLIEFDANEEVVCEIRKHYFGLLIIYFFGLLIAVITLLGFMGLDLWLENNQSTTSPLATNSGGLITLIGIILAVIISIFTLVYAYIFSKNVMLVTTDKLAQVLYRSPFNRKISQLNISDVQDVTVQQLGIFARMLKFGTLVIETAGEQQNYTFTFAAHPYECAKQIMAEREKSIKKYGN